MKFQTGLFGAGGLFEGQSGLFPVMVTSPSDISDLSAWFDASDAGSFTYSSGSSVSQWDDLGPNGYHLTQATSANQPVRDQTLNGLDVVRFSGSHWVTRSSAPINDSTDGAWTVFAIAPKSSLSGVQNIVDGDTNSGSSRVGQFIRTNSGTTESIGHRGTTAVVDTGATLTSGTAHLLRSVNGGTTTLEMFVDGSSGGSASIGGTQNYSATAPLTLGATSNASASQRHIGNIAEVICYARALTSSEISGVEAYLTDKWGL